VCSFRGSACSDCITHSLSCPRSNPLPFLVPSRSCARPLSHPTCTICHEMRTQSACSVAPDACAMAQAQAAGSCPHALVHPSSHVQPASPTRAHAHSHMHALAPSLACAHSPCVRPARRGHETNIWCAHIVAPRAWLSVTMTRWPPAWRQASWMPAVEHSGISDRECSQLLASFVFREIYIIWS